MYFFVFLFSHSKCLNVKCIVQKLICLYEGCPVFGSRYLNLVVVLLM
uniref:Uncharacterized protein n=1 Tax=Anguilla anguilla TaxID=7936 RepID=A0A0E9XZ16_ANGAN